MHNTATETREVQVVASVTCDRCGKTQEPSFGGFEGWHFFRDTGGYASPFGDMSLWELDLCEECFYALVKDFVRYPKNLSFPAKGCRSCFPTDDCPADCIERNHTSTD